MKTSILAVTALVLNIGSSSAMAEATSPKPSVSSPLGWCVGTIGMVKKEDCKNGTWKPVKPKELNSVKLENLLGL